MCRRGPLALPTRHTGAHPIPAGLCDWSPKGVPSPERFGGLGSAPTYWRLGLSNPPPPPKDGTRPRLMDLERDVEDAQATCQALTAENERHLQEVMRAGRISAGLRMIWPSCARTTQWSVVIDAAAFPHKVPGSRLRRQLEEAQRAAVDVARVVDEHLTQHLSAILEAVQMVRDERTSQPAVEQAMWGWVPEGYGPPSKSNPDFREISAALVCAAVLHADPPPSLEALNWRLWGTVQPNLRFPTEAVGHGPRRGGAREPSPTLPYVGMPGGKRAVAPAAAPPGHHVNGIRGGVPAGRGEPVTPNLASANASRAGTSGTPGREGLHSLLAHLNEIAQEPNLRSDPHASSRGNYCG